MVFLTALLGFLIVIDSLIVKLLYETTPIFSSEADAAGWWFIGGTIAVGVTAIIALAALTR